VPGFVFLDNAIIRSQFWTDDQILDLQMHFVLLFSSGCSATSLSVRICVVQLLRIAVLEQNEDAFVMAVAKKIFLTD